MFKWLQKMAAKKRRRLAEELEYLCIDCQERLKRHYAKTIFGSRLIYYCPNCNNKLEVIDPKHES
jgi:predicted SprT family Zn-dependent metalloprotease